MRVVCIAAECEPWAKTGGLGDVVDALARAVASTTTATTAAPADAEVGAGAGDAGFGAGTPELHGERRGGNAQLHLQSQVWPGTGGVMGIGLSGVSARVEPPVDVFLPRYRAVHVPEGATETPLVVPDPLSPTGETTVSIVEFEARGYRIRLIDHPPAFDRDNFYGDASGDYPDNAWRFGLLCRAAIEALLIDDRPVDVLHLHDWQAMPTVVLRDIAYEGYPMISRAAVMVTIHNLAYQGWIGLDALPGLLFPDEIKEALPVGADGLLLLREGMERAELVNTVSPGYAAEILTPAFGMGLDPILRSLGHRFGGIINGLDMAVWDPATDVALPAKYSSADKSGKSTNRRALLTQIGFDPDDDGPVLGMIGRLDPQKGFDLLAGAARELVLEGARIVALGTGDAKLVRDLKALAVKRPDAVAVSEAFDRDLARRIYAGADMYLMPSRFEPCGQGQMIALRYGTPPVVHRTGGLADTVVDVDERPGEGTGFVFNQPTTAGLLEACRRGIERYRRGGQEWEALQDRGMAIDWSWEAGPAEQYAASYGRAISLRRDH